MTVLQVGTLLRCSVRTVYRLADAGRIPPPIRLGGMSRWHRPTFEAWLAQGCPDCRGTSRRKPGPGTS